MSGAGDTSLAALALALTAGAKLEDAASFANAAAGVASSASLGTATVTPAAAEGLRRARIMSKALFLDRDGTLILDKVYLADPAGVELIPGAADSLQRARSARLQAVPFYQPIRDRSRATTPWTMCISYVNARMEEMLGLPRPLFDDMCHIAPGVVRSAFALPQACRRASSSRASPATASTPRSAGWSATACPIFHEPGLNAKIRAAAAVHRQAQCTPGDPRSLCPVCPYFRATRNSSATLK